MIKLIESIIYKDGTEIKIEKTDSGYLVSDKQYVTTYAEAKIIFEGTKAMNNEVRNKDVIHKYVNDDEAEKYIG